MALRCAVIQKNLSAFLDKQLDAGKHRQIEQHLTECSDCRHKKEELKELVGYINDVSIPTVSLQQWENTHRKLIENIDKLPAKKGLFRIPKWTFAPAGAFILALLIYVAISVIPFGGQQYEPIPVDVCLQEHSILYSEQIFPTGIMPEITITETDQTTQEEVSDEPTSDLDPLMEAYYGIN